MDESDPHARKLLHDTSRRNCLRPLDECVEEGTEFLFEALYVEGEAQKQYCIEYALALFGIDGPRILKRKIKEGAVDHAWQPGVPPKLLTSDPDTPK